VLGSATPLPNLFKVPGSASVLVSSLCVVVRGRGEGKEAALPGPCCASSVVGPASLCPVCRLQRGVNLFLARQTGFVPWEQLKSGFQWQSSAEVMMIAWMWSSTPSRLNEQQ